MAKAKPTAKDDGEKAKEVKSKEVKSMVTLRPIKKRVITLTIRGTSPLIQHQWSEKAKEMMRLKHQGKKTKDRDVREPQKEGEQAAYRTTQGKFGIPLTALKSALIGAAHKDLGIEKTLVRKAVFIPCKDDGGILEMDCDEPIIKEDPVRVGQGSADLRYRPYYLRWAVLVTFEIDAELLTTEDLCNLVDRAGFGVGIGEWRPEKGGEYGRFEVDRTRSVGEVAA